MGCRPLLILLVTLALSAAAAPGLALTPAAAPPAATFTVSVPEGDLPTATVAVKPAWVPTVEDVLATAASGAVGVTDPAREATSPAFLTAATAATPLLGASGIGVAAAVSTTGGAVAPLPGADGALLAALGNPFVTSGWNAAEATTVATGAHTVPLPPTYARTSGAMVPRAEYEAQDATTRRILDSPLAGDVSPAKVAAAVAGLALLTLVPWALYHRIRGHGTLENQTRKSIYDMVSTAPGVGVQEVAASAGVTYSTASYHLDRLVGAGMLVVSAEGARLRYYKNGGQFTEDERKLLPILESAEACRVLEAILDRPYTYRAAIAERLGVSTTTVNWHLKRLLELGLVAEAREGRSAHLYADRTRLATTLAPLSGKLPTAPDAARRILDRVAPAAPAATAMAA